MKSGSYFIPQKDMVKITSSKKVLKVFEKNDEKIGFSVTINKINDVGKSQVRTIAVTTKSVYNIKKEDIRRRIKIDQISGISLSNHSLEFVLHIQKEYDYRYEANNQEQRNTIIGVIIGSYFQITNQKMILYFHDEPVLGDFTTTEKDKKKKINRCPSQGGKAFNQDEFVQIIQEQAQEKLEKKKQKQQNLQNFNQKLLQDIADQQKEKENVQEYRQTIDVSQFHKGQDQLSEYQTRLTESSLQISDLDQQHFNRQPAKTVDLSQENQQNFNRKQLTRSSSKNIDLKEISFQGDSSDSQEIDNSLQSSMNQSIIRQKNKSGASSNSHRSFQQGSTPQSERKIQQLSSSKKGSFTTGNNSYNTGGISPVKKQSLVNNKDIIYEQQEILQQNKELLEQQQKFKEEEEKKLEEQRKLQEEEDKKQQAIKDQQKEEEQKRLKQEQLEAQLRQQKEQQMKLFLLQQQKEEEEIKVKIVQLQKQIEEDDQKLFQIQEEVELSVRQYQNNLMEWEMERYNIQASELKQLETDLEILLSQETDKESWQQQFQDTQRKLTLLKNMQKQLEEGDQITKLPNYEKAYQQYQFDEENEDKTISISQYIIQIDEQESNEEYYQKLQKQQEQQYYNNGIYVRNELPKIPQIQAVNENDTYVNVINKYDQRSLMESHLGMPEDEILDNQEEIKSFNTRETQD